MDMHPLQKALQYIGEDMDFNVHSYSGRGMYGKTCLAITGDNINLIQLGYEIAGGYGDEVEYHHVMKYKQDSMGLGTVIYWPNIPYVEEEEDEDE